ncbi:unnamed protein product [Trichobilharzia regenti]|nr:unnamed protein product [Trichobilharzia regenti]
MGIFRSLKNSKDPATVKELDKFPRFSVKLAEVNTELNFLKRRIDKHEYPKHYWKNLRRNHIYPNSKTLKRHTLNHIDAIRSRIPELERNISQRTHALYELSDDERQTFQDYVSSVIQKRCDDTTSRLTKSLKPSETFSTFPQNPKKYVFNFSNFPLTPVQMYVLSLGPKFCHVPSKTNELHTKVQFANLMSQTFVTDFRKRPRSIHSINSRQLLQVHSYATEPPLPTNQRTQKTT